MKSIRTNPRSGAPEGDEGCRLHGTAFTYGCPGCLDYVDDLAIAAQVRERLANDTGKRLTLEEFAAEVGFDLEDL